MKKAKTSIFTSVVLSIVILLQALLVIGVIHKYDDWYQNCPKVYTEEGFAEALSGDERVILVYGEAVSNLIRDNQNYLYIKERDEYFSLKTVIKGFGTKQEECWTKSDERITFCDSLDILGQRLSCKSFFIYKETLAAAEIETIYHSNNERTIITGVDGKITGTFVVERTEDGFDFTYYNCTIDEVLNIISINILTFALPLTVCLIAIFIFAISIRDKEGE